MLLVAGASGFLGHSFTREAAASGRPLVLATHRGTSVHSDIPIVSADLTQPSAVRELLRRFQPHCVVNCAAFTNVDECELDPEKARALNVALPRTLADACGEAGVGLVHISTDSVFDGGRGNYAEQDDPAPVNVYARTKLEGERAVRETLPEALVLRTNFIGVSATGTAGLADWISSRLETAQRVSGFADVIFSPLLANDLARLILAAIDAGLEGVYHAAARDSCSKYDFACRLGSALGLDTNLIDKASLADAGLTARRPLNTSLSSARLEQDLGVTMPSWDTAVTGYVALRSAEYAETLFRNGT